MVWAALKDFLRKRLCKNKDEANEAIKEFCKTELTPEKIKNYIEQLKEVTIIIVSSRNNSIL
jgi:hypothetical protein